MLFVIPCYYRGTSFEQISKSIQTTINQHKLPIDVYTGSVLNNNLKNNHLDDDRYVYAQLETLKKVVTLVKKGRYNKILFIDFFNPGVELIRYLEAGPSIKIASLIHGGTFVPGDIYSGGWFEKAELSWLNIYDRIYAPSQYAKAQLLESPKSNITIKPWGMDGINSSKYAKHWNDRVFDVVFPHRLDSDKGIDDLIAIAKRLPNVSFLITTPSSSTQDVFNDLFHHIPNVELRIVKRKASLYSILGKSKIVLSCSTQELFGYSVIEAVDAGCIPILPNGQVYEELYPKKFLYSKVTEAVKMIRDTLAAPGSALNSNQKTSFINLLQDFMEL